MPVSFSGIRSTPIFGVSNGGTGNSELTAGGVLIGQGTDPIIAITGSDGQVLTWSDAENSWIASDPTGGGGGGLSTVNTSGNLQGNGSSGSPVTLKANISLTSVTASFSGDGSQITGLTASQISGLSDAVTNIPNSALQNNSITINGSPISLGGSVTVADSSTMTFTGSGFAVGNIVAMSGALVLADYSDNMKSNAIGAVSAIDGTNITVKVFGEVTATSASLVDAVGTPMYVGPSGSVVQYSSIPSGKFATQVGYISPTSGKVVLQPRVFGQI